jgi:sugar (pentulose or hexulose) kinase
VDAAVTIRDVVEPDPEWAKAYAGSYERFRALYPALRSASTGA